MIKKATYKEVRLILGDQLNINHPWFNETNNNILYVMFELKQEQEYTKHHIQKIAAFFSAMRNFSSTIENIGHQVHYVKISDEKSSNTLVENIQSIVEDKKALTFRYLEPDEYRLYDQLKSLNLKSEIEIIEEDTHHFYTQKTELKDFFKGKKTLVMESFYQSLRIKHQILIDSNNKPLGGKWNFDKENRNKVPKNHNISKLKTFYNEVSDIIEEINIAKIDHFGSVNKEIIHWPVTREQSLMLLDDFLLNGLPLFGTFQDAMTEKSWRVYHSLLSFSLNVKMISPKEVINRSIEHYIANDTEISIAQIEGFVRQIIGWREYMRGIYWMHMPTYKNENYFNLSTPLPDLYWNAKTKMNCLKHSVKQSLEKSYAHHIQRLMVLGNFSLLAGINPDEVDAWYLGVYADAIEWVQLPNTRGMSQYADGGIVGTKPYVSSANYINKMSDYCSNCSYNFKKVHGENACPFNSLYWNFISQHEDKLKTNYRMRMMYSLWNKKDNDEQVQILKQANEYLKNINQL